MKPFIGITPKKENIKNRPHVTLPEAYVHAVERTGGIPFIIPILSERTEIINVAKRLDGLLLSGGDDIHPEFYNERPLLELELSPEERTVFEIILLKEVLKLNKPVLGICLGIQLINVALGGNLYQDIPLEIPDHLNHREKHKVRVEKNSLLYKIIGEEEITVMSGHHQAVKSTGKGLLPVATSPDDVIEAVEMKDYPFLLGLQWHPERDLEDKYTVRLFKAFVDAASKIVDTEK